MHNNGCEWSSEPLDPCWAPVGACHPLISMADGGVHNMHIFLCSMHKTPISASSASTFHLTSNINLHLPDRTRGYPAEIVINNFAPVTLIASDQSRYNQTQRHLHQHDSELTPRLAVSTDFSLPCFSRIDVAGRWWWREEVAEVEKVAISTLAWYRDQQRVHECLPYAIHQCRYTHSIPGTRNRCIL